MLMKMDNKKVAQGIANKLLKKSKDNPEMKESSDSNVYDQAKMDVAHELIGALHEKDAGKFLSAFKALHHSVAEDMGSSEEDSEIPKFPENNYGDVLANSNPVKK